MAVSKIAGGLVVRDGNARNSAAPQKKLSQGELAHRSQNEAIKTGIIGNLAEFRRGTSEKVCQMGNQNRLAEPLGNFHDIWPRRKFAANAAGAFSQISQKIQGEDLIRACAAAISLPTAYNSSAISSETRQFSENKRPPFRHRYGVSPRRLIASIATKSLESLARAL
jgi:hypothetical protein